MEHPSLLILHFLENFLTIITGGIIFNFSSQIKKVLLFSTIMSLFVYVIRSIFLIYKLPMGIHTLILMIIYGVFIKIIFEVDFKISISTSLIIFVIITASEIVLLPTFMNILHIEPKQIVNNPYIHLLLGIFDTMPFIAIVAWGYITGRFQNLFNAINN